MEESSSTNVLSGYANYLAEHNVLDQQTALRALQQASTTKTLISNIWSVKNWQMKVHSPRSLPNILDYPY